MLHIKCPAARHVSCGHKNVRFIYTQKKYTYTYILFAPVASAFCCCVRYFVFVFVDWIIVQYIYREKGLERFHYINYIIHINSYISIYKHRTSTCICVCMCVYMYTIQFHPQVMTTAVVGAFGQPGWLYR